MDKDKEKILKEISDWLDEEIFEIAKDTAKRLVDLAYNSLVKEVKAGGLEPKLTLITYEARFYQIYLVYMSMINGIVIQTLADVKAELEKRGFLD